MTQSEDKHIQKEALDLISAATHDLKAPIALIKGLNDLMSAGKLSKKKHDQYIARISMSLVQMERTLETIEKVNDVIVDQQQMALVPISINEIISSVASQLEPKAKEYDQKLVLKAGHKSYVVLSNRHILENAIYSLVDNAIKYSLPSSEILIRPSKASKKGYARLTIRDKTMGVRKSDWNRVMDTLGKIDSPNPAHAGDSGLGLFATVRLVQSLNGIVGVKPVHGGSSFFIELPIAQQLNLQLVD